VQASPEEIKKQQEDADRAMTVWRRRRTRTLPLPPKSRRRKSRQRRRAKSAESKNAETLLMD
jgi:hypothetical protein